MDRKKPTFLVDMDSITVNMTPTWLKKYYEETGDTLTLTKQTSWGFSELVRFPEELDKILTKNHFFYNLPPMPGATKYIPKLIEHGVNVIFLTQLPRKSDYAAKDKRRWIEKYIKGFDMRNIIFAHQKYLVNGDLFFDDNPVHLQTWAAYNPKGITSTIDYNYNRDAKADWRFDKKTAWKDFYEKACEFYNLK